MPIATPTSTMLSPQEILTTALREHDFGKEEPSDRSAIARQFLDQLDEPNSIPFYSASSRPLSICKFRCMLQDTGYPLEVYLPPLIGSDGKELEDDLSHERNIDWSRLKERWVGWGVEVPAEQEWAKQIFEEPTSSSSTTEPNLSLLSISETPSLPYLPPSVHAKFPLPPSSKGNYLGCLLKICDPNASFKPATVYTFTGMISSSPLPSNGEDEDEEEVDTASGETKPTVLVPTIHVLAQYTESYPMRSTLIPTSPPPATRQDLISYLSTAFEPRDELAAEVLLASLMGQVVTKRAGGIPVGTFSLNLLLAKGEGDNNETFERLSKVLGDVMPLFLPLPLSLQLLGSHPFYPSNKSTSLSVPTSNLSSGLLQLPPSTLLLINEDTLAQGQLQDRGVRNLKALVDLVKDQKLKYEYEFVQEGFGMDTDLGVVVVGVGKSLLPVDFHMPVSNSSQSRSSSESDPTSPSPSLPALRHFLLHSRSLASSFQISPDMAEHIQSEWVRLRKDGLIIESKDEDGREMKERIEVGEEDLKRWMAFGRVLALTYPEARFTKEVWQRTLELDMERRRRMAER